MKIEYILNLYEKNYDYIKDMKPQISVSVD